MTFSPNFQTAFSAYVDDQGTLLQQTNLLVQEVSQSGVIVVRTGKDENSTKNDFNKILKIDKPHPLGVSLGISLGVSEAPALCFWISEDEYWLLVAHSEVESWMAKASQLSTTTCLIDNSGAYGQLHCSGSRQRALLQRVMGYDMEHRLVANKVVSTTMTATQVVMFRLADESIHILVRNSFAGYVARLLKTTAKQLSSN